MSTAPDITGISSVPPRLTPERVDELLARVGQQVADQTFDPTQTEVFAELIECLGDVRGMKRLRTATLLGEEIGIASTPYLLDALQNHPNVVVRRAAAKTLALIENPEAIPTLLHALNHDDDTVVQGSVVGALARTGAAAAPDLLQLLSNPASSETLKGHAAWALAFMGAGAERYLYDALASDSGDVRAAVIGAIAKLVQENPSDRAFQVLLNALDDADGLIRCEAIAALGNLAHPPALPKLVALLPHPDFDTRKAAALALMKMGDTRAIEPLKTALAAETVMNLHPILKLAINQLTVKAEGAGDDDWD
ncbi:MAG: HEAT repeat domain-containing protein [Leptolyngbyaceae bacterium]|nr:HEAT repeat domain-containing protein [Leptolyngbyaceae bacterium]